MSKYTTRPVKVITNLDFNRLLNKKEIIVSPHASNHLSAEQRKVFKEKDLISSIAKETPRKIYLQENGRYAVYYRRSDGYRKLIVEFESEKAVIVSFMDPLELPKIKLK